MPYLLEKSRFGINFFAKRNTILLLYVYQVFIFLQDHFHFFICIFSFAFFLHFYGTTFFGWPYIFFCNLQKELKHASVQIYPLAKQCCFPRPGPLIHRKKKTLVPGTSSSFIHGQDNWVRLSNKIKDKTPKNLGRWR